MLLGEFADIRPEKVQALKEKIEHLSVLLSDIEEEFLKGSGRGGQKINKTESCVRLKHVPTGIIVTCQKERKRSLNRFLALRELIDQIEMKLFPQESKKLKAIQKIRKQKKRRSRRSDEKDNVQE